MKCQNLFSRKNETKYCKMSTAENSAKLYNKPEKIWNMGSAM